MIIRNVGRFCSFLVRVLDVKLANFSGKRCAFSVLKVQIFVIGGY